MDMKTIFLNGHIQEEIYMKQHEDFISENEEGKVRKLQRSIYGLKQATRSWNIVLMKQSILLVLINMKMNLVNIRRSVGALSYSSYYM